MKINPTPVPEIIYVDICDLVSYLGCVLKHVEHEGAMTEYYIVTIDYDKPSGQRHRLFNLCDGTELHASNVTGSLVHCPNASLTP